MLRSSWVRRASLTMTIGVLAVAAEAQPRPLPQRREPPPEGQRIPARDGDVIVVENDDRIRIVRRRGAMARVVVDEARRLVVVLADWLPASDGIVDSTWRFTIAEGRWPLDARWDGEVVIEDDEVPSRLPTSGALLLETAAGQIRFQGGPPAGQATGGAIAVLRYQGFAASGSNMAFDDAERAQLSDSPPPSSRMSFGYMSTSGPPSGAIVGGMGGGVTGGVVGVVPSRGPESGGALRAGGPIKPPTKIYDVKPVFPDAARAAGIQGIVILEITIAEDGSVRDALVLRSIPQLDQAAIEAVRQWRFTPTLINGAPVPIIMTVTVSFVAQR
jgi:TonB family protein